MTNLNLDNLKMARRMLKDLKKYMNEKGIERVLPEAFKSLSEEQMVEQVNIADLMIAKFMLNCIGSVTPLADGTFAAGMGLRKTFMKSKHKAEDFYGTELLFTSSYTDMCNAERKNKLRNEMSSLSSSDLQCVIEEAHKFKMKMITHYIFNK